MPNLEPIPMITLAPEFHSVSQAEFGGASARASDDWGYEAALPYLSVGGFESPPASPERA